MMAMELGSGAQLRQHALKIITDIKTCSESSRKVTLVQTGSHCRRRCMHVVDSPVRIRSGFGAGK